MVTCKCKSLWVTIFFCFYTTTTNIETVRILYLCGGDIDSSKRTGVVYKQIPEAYVYSKWFTTGSREPLFLLR